MQMVVLWQYIASCTSCERRNAPHKWYSLETITSNHIPKPWITQTCCLCHKIHLNQIDIILNAINNLRWNTLSSVSKVHKPSRAPFSHRIFQRVPNIPPSAPRFVRSQYNKTNKQTNKWTLYIEVKCLYVAYILTIYMTLIINGQGTCKLFHSLFIAIATGPLRLLHPHLFNYFVTQESHDDKSHLWLI